MIHFTAEGYRIIGKRYAEKMLELLQKQTGIGSVKTDKVTDNRWLDLSGRYVDDSYKGLVINATSGRKFF